MTTPPPPPPGRSGPAPGWYTDPYGQPVERWWDGRQWTGSVRPFARARDSSGAGTGLGIAGAIVGVIVVLAVASAIIGDDDGETATAGSSADQRCAEQWDRAATEGRTTGDDTELLATLSACQDYPTWQAEKDRVGGQSPNTLRAACMIEPDSRVCRDADDRGELD